MCADFLPFKLQYRAKREKVGGCWPLFLGTVEAWKEDVDRLQILAQPPEIGMRTTKK